MLQDIEANVNQKFQQTFCILLVSDSSQTVTVGSWTAISTKDSPAHSA